MVTSIFFLHEIIVWLFLDDSDDDGIGPLAGKSSGSKKERHFWQYNVQSKGPKGQKILIQTKIDDPHVLNEIVDPVFSGDVQLQGIKHRFFVFLNRIGPILNMWHFWFVLLQLFVQFMLKIILLIYISGKARRGDGNDLTANPRKLAAIGKELESLGREINDLVKPLQFSAKKWELQRNSILGPVEWDAIWSTLQKSKGEEQTCFKGLQVEKESPARGKQAETARTSGGTP